MTEEKILMTLSDTKCWGDVFEGLKYTFKELVKQAVDDVISEKMCTTTLEDKRLNVVELCKRWNISKNTLHTWEKNGVISPLSLGGKKKVYSMADIHDAEVNGLVKTVC